MEVIPDVFEELSEAFVGRAARGRASGRLEQCQLEQERCQGVLKPLAVRVAHHFIVRGGQIVRFEPFVDTALVRDAATPRSS